MPCPVDQGRSGGEGEYDGASAAFDGVCQHFHLMGRVILILPVRALVAGVADIITFNKIHTPGCVQFQQGIIVSLSGRRIVKAVHIRVPGTDGIGIGCHVGSDFAALYLHMVLGCNTGDPAHDMNAEFQSQAMYISSQGSEPFLAGRGGEALRVRQKAGIFIHFQSGKGNVLELVSLRTCFMCIPLDIHHNIFPSVFF